MTIDELQVLITANSNELKKEINKTNSVIKDMKRNAEKQSKGVEKVFSNLKNAIAALGIGKIIKDSIQYGMDAIESDSLFSTSLRKYANDVYDWSDKVSSALGLNAVEIRKNTGVIYNMTSSMGLAEKQALTMSKGVTLLANDMASFYNLDTDEAFNKLRAGITGETEPLKALGILVDENTIKQVAYSAGIATTGSELTQQQKVLARYVAILKQTGNAQGDLARTLDSPANLFRRLKTEVVNCATAFGSIFMPIIQTVVPYLISFVKIVGNAINGLATFLGIKSSGLSDDTADASNNVGSLADNMSDANKNAKAMKQTLAGFDEITNLSTGDSSENTSASSVSNGSSLDFDLSEYDAGLSGIEDKTSKIIDKIYEKFNKLKSFLDTIWNSGPVSTFVKMLESKVNFIKNLGMSLGKSLYENITNTWNKISEDVKTTFSNIINLLTSICADISSTIEEYAEPIIATITNLFNEIYSTIIEPIIELIVGIFKDFTQILLDLWNKYGKELLNKIGEFVLQTIKLFQSLYNNIIRPIIEPFLKTLKDLWDNNISALIKSLGEFVTKLTGLVLDIYNFVIGKIMGWLEEFKPYWEDTWNFVSSVFGTVVEIICGVAAGILDSLSGIIDFLVGVFTGDWEKAWEGIKEFFSGIWDGVVAIVKGAINLIIDYINGMIAGLETALNWIVDKVNSIEIVNPFTGEDIWSPNIPRFTFGRVAKLARGGIVDEPTISWIGEAGKEAVIPLENNTGWLDKIASKFAVMVNEMSDGSTQSTSLTSNLIVNGREIASATIEDFNNEAVRRGYRPILIPA